MLPSSGRSGYARDPIQVQVALIGRRFVGGRFRRYECLILFGVNSCPLLSSPSASLYAGGMEVPFTLAHR